MEIRDGNAILTYRETPWDQRVLGVPTNEIVSIAGDGYAVLDEFCRESNRQGIRFSAARCPATDTVLLSALEHCGFKLVGVYPNVSRQMATWQNAHQDAGLSLRSMTQGDTARVRDLIAGWRFGPFFDDPDIPDAVAQERMMNRLEQLMAETTCVVGVKDGEILAFMAYVWKGETVDLVLGGTQMGTRMGKQFWAAVLDRVREAKDVVATISATNIGVMNLYAALGFRFTTSNLALHRHA